MGPTDEEIRQAKEYLLLRLKAERVAVSEMEAALISAARRIVAIARKYSIPPERFRFSRDPDLQREIQGVLELLRDALAHGVETLDTFEDDDRRFVAPALTEPDHGRTFRQRLADYVSRWGHEVEATIAAAGLEGITSDSEIVAGIKEYLDRPYDNPWIKEHLGEGDAVRLDRIPHYGKGRPIASATALALLLSTVVAKGWMENWRDLNSGKRGYYVFRGSSFPCEICDAQTGFLHDINDKDGLPQYHPHCCCYVVYTDQR